MATYPIERMVAGIAAVAWMAGQWVGERGGERVEEHWSAPAAGAMMGMFRWVRGDAVRFYELTTLEPEGAGLVLRIKHFAPGLVGWEEKDEAVTFDLVAADAGKAVFYKRHATDQRWVIYRAAGADGLVCYFETPDSTPTETDMFRYRRLGQDGG